MACAACPLAFLYGAHFCESNLDRAGSRLLQSTDWRIRVIGLASCEPGGVRDRLVGIFALFRERETTHVVEEQPD